MVIIVYITCLDLKICIDFVIFGNMTMCYYYCYYTIQFAANEVRRSVKPGSQYDARAIVASRALG